MRYPRTRVAIGLSVLGLLAAGGAAGCIQPGGGILLTPVSPDKKLDETTVHSDSWLARDKIVVVDVEGMLANAESGPMFGPKENPVAMFAEKLDKAAADPAVKVLLLRINSPGGTVAASDIMYRTLLEFRARRKDVKVVASVLDLGASGAYYLACGAEKIYALPTSLTGSIGVIFQTFSLEGTLKKIGVQTQAIKSGENKDMASPLRDRKPEEVKLLQEIIDRYYDGFLKVVLAGRKNLTEAKLRPLADGRVYTGDQAKEVGLVDELLYPQQIIDKVKADAGIRRARVVIYHRPAGYKGTIYSQFAGGGGGAGGGSAGSPTVNLINLNLAELFGPASRQPQFLYVWTAP